MAPLGGSMYNVKLPAPPAFTGMDIFAYVVFASMYGVLRRVSVVCV